MKHMVVLHNGASVPALGQGSWYLGEHPEKKSRETDAIRTGIQAGMTLLDTAEMYGGGQAEELLGDAIQDVPRNSLTIVSKVLPQNAGGVRMEKAVDQSLLRLGTDYLDLYLYHWRGRLPLAETVSGLEKLKKKGKIRAWGVSNFDTDDMEELWHVPNGDNCLVNQVLYHPASRGIEFSLLPWMYHHNVALMAYCPLAQGGRLSRGLLSSPVIRRIAEKHSASPSQIILAWDIRDGRTIAIPRSGCAEHVLSNAGADSVNLDQEDLRLIDSAFPCPDHKMPLDIQ